MNIKIFMLKKKEEEKASLLNQTLNFTNNKK